jgi:ABC-type branched-subunit amino acid transport system permease subunit
MRIALYALVFAAAFAFTLQANSYYVFIMATLALTAIVGIGLNVLLGLSGQVSFGHVGFYALGAYTVAVLTVAAKWSFWAALPVAALLAAVTGALLALPAVRVRGPYLAMVTIAFGFIIEHVAVEWRGLTGGQNGIMGIPPPAGFGERGMALMAIVFAAAATWGYAFFSKTHFGSAMRAVKDAEVAAESIGLAPVRVKTAAFGPGTKLVAPVPAGRARCFGNIRSTLPTTPSGAIQSTTRSSAPKKSSRYSASAASNSGRSTTIAAPTSGVTRPSPSHRLPMSAEKRMDSSRAATT